MRGQGTRGWGGLAHGCKSEACLGDRAARPTAKGERDDYTVNHEDIISSQTYRKTGGLGFCSGRTLESDRGRCLVLGIRSLGNWHSQGTASVVGDKEALCVVVVAA